MLVSQTSPVVSYETQSSLAKIEIADGSVSEKAIENKKTKWYSRRVKEAIHIRLNANDMPTVRQHDNRYPPKRTAKGIVSSSDNINNALVRTHRPRAKFVFHQSLTTTVV